MRAVIDGDAGVVIVDPSPIILAEYGFKQRQGDLERGRLSRLRHKPAVTLDGERVELLANIELPEDTFGAVKAGAAGVGPDGGQVEDARDHEDDYDDEVATA